MGRSQEMRKTMLNQNNQTHCPRHAEISVGPTAVNGLEKLLGKNKLTLSEKLKALSIYCTIIFASILLNHTADAAQSKDEDPAVEAQLNAYQKRSQQASPKKLLKMVNEGWGDFYTQAKKDLNPRKSYVVLHAWDPGMVIDLRTADGFRSTLLSRGLINIQDFSIGHTWLGWRCKTKNGKMLEGAAGVTGESENQAAEMLQSGWGLSAFKATFTDGLIQWPELLEWGAYGEKGNLHSLFIEVDPATCLRTAGFVETYITHPKQPRRFFGLEPDPSKFEGGGCGSFGIVAANQGRIFGSVDLTSKMWRNISARSNLFGRGPVVPPKTRPFLNSRVTQNRVVEFVSPFTFFGEGDVLFSNWNGVRGQDPQLRILDPEMLVLAMRQVYRLKYRDLARSNSKIAQDFLTSKNKAYAYRTFESSEWSETPKMRAWRLRNGGRADELRFDQSLDPQAQQIVNLTRYWMSEAGFRARFTSVNEGHPAVILERPRK